jgi:3-methylfumaryl-CoA hydratase
MAATLDQTGTYRIGDTLPHGWHWLYFPEVVPQRFLGQDGHPAPGVTMPPVSLPRRMWAGGRLLFDAKIALGTEARRVSTISAITPKRGRSGTLCFVTLEHEVFVEGRCALRETQRVLYREPRAAHAPEPLPPPGTPDQTAVWDFDPVTLFRYSALTFNAHRIHYDVDYARAQEGYPGLVVQGPLLATVLMDLAARCGADPRMFEYSARSPAFVPERVTTNLLGSDDPSTALRLWVAGADGRLIMDANCTRHVATHA